MDLCSCAFTGHRPKSFPWRYDESSPDCTMLKGVLTEQIKNDPKMAGKPEKVIEGAVNGRLNKELKEVCLLEQVYVKAEDGKQSVAKYLEQVAKENNAKLSVKRFVRFETGEGIEKKEENFAEEVAKQMGM